MTSSEFEEEPIDDDDWPMGDPKEVRDIFWIGLVFVVIILILSYTPTGNIMERFLK